MTSCEQVISCPESLRDDTIQFKTKGDDVTAYLVKKLPKILPYSNETTTHLTIHQKSLSDNAFVANSFNLVKGSILYWDIPASRSFAFYLVQGNDEMDKFINYDQFHPITKDTTSHPKGSYKATSSDEYYVIVEAAYGSSTIYEHTYEVDHTRYDVSDFIKKSNDSHKFSVSDDLVPGACIIAEMSCSAKESDTTDIKIEYLLDRSTLFWVCLAFAIVFGLSMCASIILCAVCIVRKKKQQGTTYQNVASSPAQAPAYPAGYQQPQPTTVYQQPQAPAAYNPAAPVYPTAGGAPPAVAPAYNPAYNPSYGTAPPVY